MSRSFLRKRVAGAVGCLVTSGITALSGFPMPMLGLPVLVSEVQGVVSAKKRRIVELWTRWRVGERLCRAYALGLRTAKFVANSALDGACYLIREVRVYPNRRLWRQGYEKRQREQAFTHVLRVPACGIKLSSLYHCRECDEVLLCGASGGFCLVCRSEDVYPLTSYFYPEARLALAQRIRGIQPGAARTVRTEPPLVHIE